jgi:hypothetical protein
MIDSPFEQEAPVERVIVERLMEVTTPVAVVRQEPESAREVPRQDGSYFAVNRDRDETAVPHISSGLGSVIFAEPQQATVTPIVDERDAAVPDATVVEDAALVATPPSASDITDVREAASAASAAPPVAAPPPVETMLPQTLAQQAADSERVARIDLVIARMREALERAANEQREAAAESPGEATAVVVDATPEPQDEGPPEDLTPAFAAISEAFDPLANIAAEEEASASVTEVTHETIESTDVDALIAPLLSDIAVNKTSDRDGDTVWPVSTPADEREVFEERVVHILAEPAGSEHGSSVELNADEPAREPEPEAEREPAPDATLQATSAAPDTSIDPMFFADDALIVPPPTAAQEERSAWIELVGSLRQDIERLKAERVTMVAEPPSETTGVQRSSTLVASVDPPLQAVDPPLQTNDAATPRPAPRRSRVRARRPVEDQWGLFDPEQCGFAALLAKLDEISARDDATA